jgi:regulator of protease activity HflC (stomatin/prohibitin superfamily)
MFDKIIEFIIRFWKDLLPFVIVEHWNEALILRFGIFKKLLKPGIHFKIPFFDSVWETIVITQSIDMNPQSITTAGTSWLGDNFDSVLLYGSLVEAYTFMKGETDMLAVYDSKYKEALAMAKRLGDGMERQDAYRSGQYRQAVT